MNKAIAACTFFMVGVYWATLTPVAQADRQVTLADGHICTKVAGGGLKDCDYKSPKSYDVEGYAALYKDFQSEVDIAAQNDTVPLRSIPDIDTLLTKMSDTDKYLDADLYSVEDYATDFQICKDSGEAAKVYLGFHTDNINKNQSEKLQLEEARKLIKENTLKYQDEIYPLNYFTISCSAELIGNLSKIAAKIPVTNQVATAKTLLAIPKSFETLGEGLDLPISDHNAIYYGRLIIVISKISGELLPPDKRADNLHILEKWLTQYPRYSEWIKESINDTISAKCNDLCQIAASGKPLGGDQALAAAKCLQSKQYLRYEAESYILGMSQFSSLLGSSAAINRRIENESGVVNLQARETYGGGSAGFNIAAEQYYEIYKQNGGTLPIGQVKLETNPCPSAP